MQSVSSKNKYPEREESSSAPASQSETLQVGQSDGPSVNQSDSSTAQEGSCELGLEVTAQLGLECIVCMENRWVTKSMHYCVITCFTCSFGDFMFLVLTVILGSPFSLAVCLLGQFPLPFAFTTGHDLMFVYYRHHCCYYLLIVSTLVCKQYIESMLTKQILSTAYADTLKLMHNPTSDVDLIWIVHDVSLKTIEHAWG